MGVWVRCPRCGNKIEFPFPHREYLPPAFRLVCPFCGYDHVYAGAEIHGPSMVRENVERFLNTPFVRSIIEEMLRNVARIDPECLRECLFDTRCSDMITAEILTNIVYRLITEMVNILRRPCGAG